MEEEEEVMGQREDWAWRDGREDEEGGEDPVGKEDLRRCQPEALGHAQPHWTRRTSDGALA